jgi:predicted transposase YdaD
MSFDNVCKFLAEQYPQVFVKWLLNSDETSIRVLKTELNVNPIHADSVLFLRVGKQILHLEFQTEPKSKPPLPLRMLDYYVRLKRKYNYSIIQVIIFLQKSNSEFVFQEQYEDKNTIHKYRIIRLWEEEATSFLSEPILYPFAVLAKSESPQQILEEVATKVNDIEEKELQSDLMTSISILAGLKLDKNFIQSLLKEEIMRSSVIYQEIKKQGKMEGKIEGKMEGKMEEALSLIFKIVNQHLGKIEQDLSDKIQALSLEKMEELTLALFDFDCLEDLELWLEYNS